MCLLPRTKATNCGIKSWKKRFTALIGREWNAEPTNSCFAAVVNGFLRKVPDGKKFRVLSCNATSNGIILLLMGY